MYLTALHGTSPLTGPALTITGLIPDLHHYKGSRWSCIPAVARSRGERTEPAAEPARLPRKEVQNGRERGRDDGVHRRRYREPGLHGPLSGRSRPARVANPADVPWHALRQGGGTRPHDHLAAYVRRAMRGFRTAGLPSRRGWRKRNRRAFPPPGPSARPRGHARRNWL